MVLVIVESSYSPALDDASERRIVAQLRSQLAYRDVCWLRTLFSLDRCRFISELEAADAESVRELYRIAGISFDRIWTAQIQDHTPCDCDDRPSVESRGDFLAQTQPDSWKRTQGDRPIWFHDWFSNHFPML